MEKTCLLKKNDINFNNDFLIKINFNKDSYMRKTGAYLICSAAGEKYHAFIPNHLPLQDPLKIDNDVMQLYDNANISPGRLDGLSTIIPDTSLFLYFYI